MGNGPDRARWGEFGRCGRWWWDGGAWERPRRTVGGMWGGRVEDELAHGTASGAAVGPRRGWVARLGLDVGWQFEGGHIPIGPPQSRFLLLCVCVGAARLGRKILKKSESLPLSDRMQRHPNNNCGDQARDKHDASRPVWSYEP